MPRFKSLQTGFSFHSANIHPTHTSPPTYTHCHKLIAISALPYYVVGADN